MSILSFFVVSVVFFAMSSNLLLLLLVLEMLSFLVLFQVSHSSFSFSSTDFLLLALFSVFVMEGVVALSGMISLVSTTGSDSVGSSSMLNF